MAFMSRGQFTVSNLNVNGGDGDLYGGGRQGQKREEEAYQGRTRTLQLQKSKPMLLLTLGCGFFKGLKVQVRTLKQKRRINRQN